MNFDKFLIAALKEHDKKVNDRSLKIDPEFFIGMINKRVEVDNSMMLERVIDTEIFGGLVKGVRSYCVESKLNVSDLVAEDNLE